MTDSVTGANRKDTHLRNVNVNRDFKPDLIGDLRYAASGDGCPKCGKPLAEVHALELGHVFKLGTKYTEALDVKYLDEKGEKKTVIMGCYGIGVNRILAAHIEEHHDAKGMVWSKGIAPYSVLLITLNQSDPQSAKIAGEIYETLSAEGIDVLYDDRNERAGVKFNDGDLIGIPLQVIVSERNLKEGKLEVCKRFNKETSKIQPEELLAWIRNTLAEIS
ncbi:MAG TPA: His/Gly/Thr/Pro-type tRNA ligase C-terminal domain-containing protein [Candidatus Omnitrophota bacterium]|nr:His/Gly/Thr/Pro-type tRNA ligase C-terminal domain-containing protein [Candidatus Omnitrophota bacterium]